MNKIAFAEAHGKIIIIGEHSVVYKHGAIVAPFSQATVRVEITQHKDDFIIESAYHTGLFYDNTAPIEGLQALLTHFINKYNIPAQGLKFKVTSNILSRRGLGSSAAVAKAFAEALLRYFNISYNREDLKDLITVSELVYHFKPSGIDMNAVLSDTLLWYQDGQFLEFKPHFPFYIVVADTAKASQTKLSVSAVAAQVKANNSEVISALERLGELALKTKQILENGDINQLAKCLKSSQQELETIGVSSEEIRMLIEQAYKYDALAAKLTGGGQGGCIFALFADYKKCEKFAKIMNKQGVSHTWIMEIK